MKNLKLKTVALILGVGILTTFNSCKKAPKDASMNVKFSLSSSGIDLGLGKTAGANSLLFTNGSITIVEIVIDGERVVNNRKTESVSVTHEEVSTIDFTSSTSTPDVSGVVIPEGDYNDLNLGIELRDEDSIPAVVYTGTYTNTDGDVLDIRFEFNSGEVFEVEGEAVEISTDQSAVATVDFDPHSWFSTITSGQMDSATLDSSGTIIISEDVNSNIFDIVADRLDLKTQATFN